MGNGNGNGEAWRKFLINRVLPATLAIVAFFMVGFFTWNSDEHEKIRCDVKELNVTKVEKERYVADISRIEGKLDNLHDTLEQFILAERRYHNQ